MAAQMRTGRAVGRTGGHPCNVNAPDIYSLPNSPPYTSCFILILLKRNNEGGPYTVFAQSMHYFVNFYHNSIHYNKKINVHSHARNRNQCASIESGTYKVSFGDGAGKLNLLETKGIKE